MTGRSASATVSLWASYGDEDEVEELGTENLDQKETTKVWDLIDALEIPDRKKGKKDEDEGYVQLRLREPGGDEGHDIFTDLRLARDRGRGRASRSPSTCRADLEALPEVQEGSRPVLTAGARARGAPSLP